MNMEHVKLSNALFEVSRASTDCPGIGCNGMKWNIEQWWNDTDSGETDVLGGNPVPLPLCPPLVSHGLVSNPHLHDEA
jgi:hypothetical protein